MRNTAFCTLTVYMIFHDFASILCDFFYLDTEFEKSKASALKIEANLALRLQTKTRYGNAPASGFSYAVIALLSETLTRLKSENRIIQPT